MNQPQLLFPDTTAEEFRTVYGEPEWNSIFSSDKRLTHEELISQAERDHTNVLMVRTTQYPIDHKLITRLPSSIRLINIQATGTDNIDLETARERDILVSTVPVSDYAAVEVAEHVFALIFGSAKRLLENDSNVREGIWRSSPCSDSLVTVAGKTLGVIGYGTIGKQVVKMGRLLGMKPVVHTRVIPTSHNRGVTFTDLETTISQSDVLVICVSLNETSFNMFNRERIGLIKRGAIAVNIARGLVVHEESFAAAADKGHLFYCADVFSREPVTPDHPLVTAKNTLLSPHIAWKTQETVYRSYELWMENVKAFFEGKPVRVADITK